MDARRIDDLVDATDRWYGGVPVPDWFDPEPGETVYAVIAGVELLELRDARPPLSGGSSTVDVTGASAMTYLQPGASRSILIHEHVPARDSGVAVVTSERVVFHGDRDRSWRYHELEGMTHDTRVPESWLTVRSRKRVSGLRYPGAAALQIRFTLALAVATRRQERPVLRAWLLDHRAALAPAMTPPLDPSFAFEPPASDQTSSAGARLRRGLALVYLGKKGVAPPLRIAQGVLAAFATLAVLGAVLPDPDPQPREVELTAAEQSEASARDAAAESERKGVEEAVKRQDEERARVAAEEEAARKAEDEAARVAAEQEAARKAAEEAARVAAEQEAARMAAEQEAARQAAETAAAQKAAADRAAAAAQA